ncbi:ANTAR domain-containing protein [Yinghuangia soli]|uniref:ANTAR domain-containing protein n=1 Tax=Yinghuangia soli TaxID=2908204 RepID=A0AA41Q3F2_9ACTN|nr:ANTAR domain-containing protein [Yinghuangia soli]MCF2530270.1 ANTAR domain-containing protein [Yinghuangia soli]
MTGTAPTDAASERREPSAPAATWRFSRPPHPQAATEAPPDGPSGLGPQSPVALATTLAAHAGMLAHQPSVRDTLREVVQLATDTVPGVEHAGITVAQRKPHKRTRRVVSPASTAASGSAFEALCAAHLSAGQGPCLEACGAEPVVLIKDMSHEPRWPRFALRAGRIGVGSMLVCHLATRGDRVETLTLYARDTDALGEDAAPIAALYAAHAALALWSASRIESLAGAVETRQVIGEAVGVLMATRHLTDVQAIGLITAASQQSNVPVRDIAGYVTRTGTLPGPAPLPGQRR